MPKAEDSEKLPLFEYYMVMPNLTFNYIDIKFACNCNVCNDDPLKTKNKQHKNTTFIVQDDRRLSVRSLTVILYVVSLLNNLNLSSCG